MGEMNEITVISYPKCGRTWLRLMLSQAFASHFGVANANLLELEEMAGRQPNIPRVVFSHDGPANLKTADELLAHDKQEYAGSKTVLLVRDPADVVVSYYFERTRRREVFNPERFPTFNGDLSTFLREERGGLDSILAFYQSWANHQHVPAAFLLVRYEDMHADAGRELRRILNFMNLPSVSAETIQEAVSFGRFDNMRRLEQQNSLASERLQPANPDDPESYKTRRGLIGGFTDYLSPEDITYVLTKQRQLPSLYGYSR